MSNEHLGTAVNCEITDVSAHRFILTTATGRILTDVGPNGEIPKIKPVEVKSHDGPQAV